MLTLNYYLSRIFDGIIIMPLCKHILGVTLFNAVPPHFIESHFIELSKCLMNYFA